MKVSPGETEGSSAAPQTDKELCQPLEASLQREARTEEEDRKSLYRPGWRCQQGTKQGSGLRTPHPGKGLALTHWEMLQSFIQRSSISRLVFFFLISPWVHVENRLRVSTFRGGEEQREAMLKSSS